MTDRLQVANVPKEKTAVVSIDQTALLMEVVAQVRHDSVKESQEYLDETTVPHGGE